MIKPVNPYETDWLTFFLEVNIDLFHVLPAEDVLTIFSTGRRNSWNSMVDFSSELSSRIIELRIIYFKFSTRYLDAASIIKAVQKEKANDFRNTEEWKKIEEKKWGNLSEQAYFKADIIYKDFLNQLEKKLKEPVQKHEELLISNLTPKQIELLNLELRAPENNFILAETELEHFTKIFMPEVIEKKIVWLLMTKKGKSEIPNKLSLCELFFELRDAKLVNFKNATLLRFLPQKFKPFEGEFTTFDYNNLPTATNTSQFSETIHKIVIRVKKALG